MAHPAHQPDPAPALTRGLELLRRLERDGAASLERLARDTGWPKSSVARLLLSLEAGGAVWRDPVSRRYHARLHLVPVAGTDERLAAAWRRVADRFARDAGQTVELHRFDGKRLVMIDRLEPEDAAVSANARIGSERDFVELEALTQTVLAFAPGAAQAAPARQWVWKHGRRTTVPRARRERLVARARTERVAHDAGVNEHGVFRYAAPILDEGRLRAVVAVAQVCVPASTTPDPNLVRLMRDAGEELTGLLSLRLIRET